MSRDAPRRTAAAQPPQVRASLDALAANLSRISSPSPRIRSVLRRATLALSQLQKLSAQWPAVSPEDYRDNLSGEVQALEAALTTNPSTADRRSPLGTSSVETIAATIESVAEDLEVKLEHCNRSGGKLGGSVTVRVRTIQGSNEIRSWQVFYMPRVFEAAANASPDLFPQLSSPTEDTLVPGRYVMWVRDPASARVGERTVSRSARGRRSWSWICRCRRRTAMTDGVRWSGRQRRLWLAVAAVVGGRRRGRSRIAARARRGDAGGRAFAALASAAIVALSILPFIIWRGDTRPPMWLAAAIAALLLGLGSYSAGGYAQRACTAHYAESRWSSAHR